MKKKIRQFELTTSENAMDMPYQLFATSRQAALNRFRRTKHKGEKLISLKESKWPSWVKFKR